jgi:hypothetical protein
MRVIYTSKGMPEKVWGARYTLGARYLPKNAVFELYTYPSARDMEVHKTISRNQL